MNNNIKAGIIGGAGYTGGEAIRLLLNHPNVELTFIHSRSNAGKFIYEVHTDLLGETNLQFSSEINEEADVIFFCVGHGESKELLEQLSIPDSIKIIDLSQDFRLTQNAVKGERKFVYGLPEINKSMIQTAGSIANPGCFATAIQLALLPLASKGLLNDVHVSGITGSSGAGQKLQKSSHFTWRANNIEAYKSLRHQHMYEVTETLQGVQQKPLTINFMPLRGDFTRGIYVSAYAKSDMSIEALYELYESFYASHPFTTVSGNMINLKQVVNTNKCLVHLEKEGDNVIVHSAIDNLLKGASGQAVQNMNIMFGLDETTGLKLKATSF